jgi:hypothetical protein
MDESEMATRKAALTIGKRFPELLNDTSTAT